MTTPRNVWRVVLGRDVRCVWCPASRPCDPDTWVPQHRQGGMGGRRNKHRLSNVIVLCSLVNGLIESDPTMQTEAKRRGVKISLHANPVHVPVHYQGGVSFWLTDDGRRLPVGSEPPF